MKSGELKNAGGGLGTRLGSDKTVLHFPNFLFICAFFILMFSVAGGSRLYHNLYVWQDIIGMKTLTSHNARSKQPHQKPLAATSSLASSCFVSWEAYQRCRQGNIHHSATADIQKAHRIWYIYIYRKVWYRTSSVQNKLQSKAVSKSTTRSVQNSSVR